MGVTRRGGVWYVKWKRADDVWVRRATTARTKKQALDLHAEFRRQAERQQAGLEALPPEVGYTLAKLCEWWLDNHVSERSLRRAKSMVKQHVTSHSIGSLSTRRISAELLEQHLAKLAADGYAPRSVNLLRANLGAVFEAARRARLWAGENPARGTKRRPVPPAPRPTFTADEVELIIANVPEDWRGFFATAAYLGLRKGELCGLRKSDYDKAERTLSIGRSYRHQGTKGKRVDVLPVTATLAKYLDAALKMPGAALFPGPTGDFRNEEASPEDVMRAAMKRAELIDGYRYVCRRCKAKGKKPEPILRATSEALRCKACNMLLWCSPVPRAFRFHDMRHTCATLLLRAGVPVQHVQRILRHSNISITVGTYGHLLTEDLRSAVELLGPQPVHGTEQQGSNVGGKSS